MSNSSIPNCTASNANSTECVDYFQHQQDIAFATSLAINVILFAVFFTLFILARCLKRHQRIYEPLTDVPPVRGFFLWGWAVSAWNVSNEDVERKRGLDAVMYLKILKYMFWVVLAYNVYGWIVLVPVHATAGGILTGIAKIGMGNVPQGNAALTADLIGVWLNSIVASIAFFVLYKRYVGMRMRYRSRSDRVENYVVLVREFPWVMKEQEIADAFERWFPRQVMWVCKAFRTDHLWNLLQLRTTVGTKLEQAQAYNIKNAEKNKRQKVGTMPPLFICGKRVDAEEYFTTLYAETTEKIERKQDIVATDTNEKYACGAAFVCFNNINAAKMASQTKLKFELGKIYASIQESWEVDMAPHPESVLWPYVRITHLERWIRSLIVNILTFLLIFFWMIPVGFASSLANLQTLSTVLPFLVPLLDVIPVVKGFIQGFLPGLVLIIFFAILVSLIITPLAKAEGQWDMGVIKRSIYNKYFLFLAFNIFLGSILASGFFQVMGEIVQNPNNIVNLLAKSLPTQVVYFTTYVMIQSLSKFSMLLWRPGPLITSYLLRCCASSKRDKRNLTGVYLNTLPSNMSIDCLIFLLCTVYSTMNPLILPFGLIYFGLAYITNRYQLIYLWKPDPPTEGNFWPSVWTRLNWTLVVYQAALGGILGLALFPAAASLFAAAVIQLFFWWWTDRMFHQVGKFGTCDHREPGEDDPFFLAMPRNPAPAPTSYLFYTLRAPEFVLEDQSIPDADDKKDQEKEGLMEEVKKNEQNPGNINDHVGKKDVDL